MTYMNWKFAGQAFLLDPLGVAASILPFEKLFALDRL
jgi:hypothetical protein